jgi:methylamine dehydrogenase accessory protein MauD
LVQSFMIALLVVVLLALARQIGILYRRLPPVGARLLAMGPRIGEVVDRFLEPGLNGEMIGPYPDVDRRLLLVFISSGCSGCGLVAPALRSIAKSDHKTTDVVLVSHAGDEGIKEFAGRNALDELPIVVSDSLAERFGVSATPYAVLVDEVGRVQGLGLVNTLEHLESLIKSPPVDSLNFETLTNAAVGAAESPRSPHANEQLLQIERVGEHRHA